MDNLYNGTDIESTVKELERAFEDKTAWQKFCDFMLRLLENIKNLGLYDGAKITKLENEFAKVVKSENAQNKNTTKNSDVKQSINPKFASEVDEWSKNGKSDDEVFVLGSTSDVLQGLGARENDIYLNSEKINFILKDHTEMSIDVIKKIPNILENPILILKSKNKIKNNSRLVMFGRVNAENGNPVLCVLDLLPIENKLVVDDMQKLTSAYTKTNPKENIKHFFEDSDVLYTSKNKKITTNLLTRVGFSMPTDLLKSGYIGSITYGNENVKIEGLPFNQVFSYDTNISISENKKNDTEAEVDTPAFSISEKTDADYLKAVENGDMETAQKMVDEKAKRAGYNIRAYHGTARGDRVGNVFLPERATSGPMAFFTSDKQIAENYSKSKRDTSMAYDPDYDQYETQFRIKTKYQDIPLYRAWGYLPFEARRKITKKAGQLREDWDGDGDLILDTNTNEANGGFQWQLKTTKGNAIHALIEQWLNSGTLFNEERRFLDVLEMTGVTEEFKKIGMDSLYFKDPDAKHEKVYDTFLKMTKLFDTASVNEDFIASLESWYDKQDHSKYETESVHTDLWDKNSIDAYEFVYRLRDDLANNTTHAWTSIPDSVTDYLKLKGYNGIKDTGGKYSGESHIVYIPFSSEQIKSAEPVVYDDDGNVIPLSKRFDETNDDIRFSISDENSYSYDSLVSKPDMKITSSSKTTNAEFDRYTKEPNSVFAKEMVAKAKESNNPQNTDTQTYLHNDDTDSDIMVSKDSYKHGIGRKITKAYISVSKNIPNILKNAIAVNELTPREDTNGAKVFIGMAEYSDNYVFVRMVVENRTHKLNDYDILYAIAKESIKKEDVGLRPPDYPASRGSATSSIISIADLLQNVKGVKLVTSVLSKDVCKKLGIERPDSVFSDDLKFSTSDDFDGLVDEYGAIPEGMNAERDIAVPKKTSDNQFTSYAARSIMEKGSVDDATLEKIKEQVINEALSHKRWSDKEALHKNN